MITRKIRVLVVDDSALFRQTMCDILESDEEIEVMGTASDPIIASQKMRKELPDVITLDLHMPRMDGITFLRKIMSQRPLPVVVCSVVAEDGADATFKALEYGAVDIILKPKLQTRKFLFESSIRICEAVKAAAHAKVRRIPENAFEVPPKLPADSVIRKLGPVPDLRTTEKVLVVGASTGGTEAIRVLLESLPAQGPPTVVVQHMPEHFTAAFARRLNELCPMSVKEAADGDAVARGRVLIAPGNRHTLLKRSGLGYVAEVKDGPFVCRHRPSVDVLFRSAARYAGRNAIGVLLTGMGDDGARGLLEMKEAGAFTIAQDQDSCVVFGMPAEAVKLGAVDAVLPLDQIGGAVLKSV
jgi:two-component system, chemotaxis family, protein-glutamate methylesterase/glutaminase